ncbi:MAG: hypothetical protein IT305_23595 [Chloroflexi bacterium]|nr:hypothetical protein [Chloroflexota bacterium]
MTGRLVASLAAALLALTTTVGTTFAWPDRLAGRPEQLEVGGETGYYIWTDGDDVHLSTTNDEQVRFFRAVVRTDGEIQDVDQARLEDGDSYALEDGGRQLEIRFTTANHIDNIRWQVRGGTYMRFDLNVDGHPIRSRNVYLGADGHHPWAPTFRVAR